MTNPVDVDSNSRVLARVTFFSVGQLCRLEVSNHRHCMYGIIHREFHVLFSCRTNSVGTKLAFSVYPLTSYFFHRVHVRRRAIYSKEVFHNRTQLSSLNKYPSSTPLRTALSNSHIGITISCYLATNITNSKWQTPRLSRPAV